LSPSGTAWSQRATGLRSSGYSAASRAVAAGLAGLTPAQHQLLLAVRGHPEPAGPTIRDEAGYLFLRHHSAVELVDRAHSAGLVERRTDPADARAVRLGLTALGKNRLDKLATAHLKELARLESELHALWEGLDTTVDARPAPTDRRTGRR
jgi:DNA-binding MarR family transcriptional regulator